MDEAAPEKKKKTRRPPKKVTESWLHNAGLHYLQRFAASKDHFRRVMTRKIDRSCRHHQDQDRTTCLAMLETQIKKFEELALLNDAGYARAMVTSLRRRGLSTQAIQARLSAKGLSKDEITTALQDHDEDLPGNPDMIAALRTARKKKIGPFALRETERNKELAALARAGFDFDTARRALDMERDEAEAFLNAAA